MKPRERAEQDAAPPRELPAMIAILTGSVKACRSASRCATRGRPVWLMMMARACDEPRASQNTIVPLTTPCVVGPERVRAAVRGDRAAGPARRSARSSPRPRRARADRRDRCSRTRSSRRSSHRLRGSQFRPSRGAADAHDLRPLDRFAARQEQRVQEAVDHASRAALSR